MVILPTSFLIARVPFRSFFFTKQAKKIFYILSRNVKRVLEGSFVNLGGASESNMEADLMQENSVKVMRNLIKQLSANKTMSTIKRTTAASDTIKLITAQTLLNCHCFLKYMSTRIIEP